MYSYIDDMSDTSIPEDVMSFVDETPRRRRAAALAAQKNWQMLTKDQEEDVITEDDVIFISQKNSSVKSVPNQTNHFSISVQNVDKSTSSANRTVIANKVLIDLAKNKKRIIDLDGDYMPEEEVIDEEEGPAVVHRMRAKKSITTPVKTISILRYEDRIKSLNRSQDKEVIGNRLKGRAQNQNQLKENKILIESEKGIRSVVRTDGNRFKRPIEDKLHPNEPKDILIVAEEVEEIVGTYEVNAEECNGRQNDDSFDELDLNLFLFCDSEEDDSQDMTSDLGPNKDIAVAQEILSSKAPKVRRKDGKLDSLVGDLNMDCESVDDEFTDCLCFDCEDDILSISQWNRSTIERKDYTEYSKAVVSTKNVKFLPESEVKEPIGTVTNIVSETTKAVQQLTPFPTIATARRRFDRTVQSIGTPLSSPVVQTNANVLSTGARPLPLIATQNLPLNGVPITLLPVSTSTQFSNNIRVSPLRVILTTTASTTPTYVVFPRPNVGAVQPISIRHNFITTNSSPIIRSPQPRYRAATPNPSRLRLPTAFRAPTPPTTPQMVLLNTNNAINGRSGPLFDCLAVLKSSQKPTKTINTRTLLTIKPLPITWPSKIDDLISSLMKLDNALMKEKFKECPIDWMVSRDLIVPPKCGKCPNGLCNQVTKDQTTKCEYWKCNNQLCASVYPIEKPKVFSSTEFNIPVSKLLFIIYYWSIRVDVEDLIKTGQIEISPEEIFSIWQQLQRVCSFTLRTKEAKLGFNGRVVEVASVQVGQYFVLGALELVTRHVRVCVVPACVVPQRNNIKHSLIDPMLNWLTKKSNVRTCEPKFENLKNYGINVTIVSKNEFLKGSNLSSIGGYLIYHLQKFFKDFDLSTISYDILNNVMNELLWRESFGTNPFSAFYHIIQHIGEQCNTKRSGAVALSSLYTTRPRPTPNPISVPSRTYSRPVLNDSNSVFVDEYYYSSLKLKNSLSKDITEEEPKDSIQCHLCQMFFNNILIIKHLMEHLEQERGGRVRKGDNNEVECKHCLRFFSNRTLHMHEELSNLQMVPYSCRVCSVPFYARQPFLQHMKTTHFSGEMPYYCDICLYRSSFQKNLFDHFEQSHSNISQILCPFCIRVFDLKDFKNLSKFVYRHIQSHYAVASVYDCNNCVLTFTSKPDLKDHCFKGHNPSITFDEKFEIKTFVVPEEDKNVCVRAKEEELFTPFLPNFGDNGITTESESNSNTGTDWQSNTDTVISCEPNIADLLSIEPECQISLTEDITPSENFILPVDCDYSNEQLIQIMTKTLGVHIKCDNSEEMDVHMSEESGKTVDNSEERVDSVLGDSKIGVCVECKAILSMDHFISRSHCQKCNFTTHCKTSYEQHISGAHSSAPQLFDQISILRYYSSLNSYKIVCRGCGFITCDGNQMALHMTETKHKDLFCKPLKPMN